MLGQPIIHLLIIWLPKPAIFQASLSCVPQSTLLHVKNEKYLFLRTTEPGRWSSPMELLKKNKRAAIGSNPLQIHSTMNYQFQQSRTTTMNCPLQLTTATSSTMLNQPQHGLTEATSSCAMPQLNKQSSACPMPELRRGITPPVVLPASMPTFGAPSKKSDLLAKKVW